MKLHTTLENKRPDLSATERFSCWSKTTEIRRFDLSKGDTETSASLRIYLGEYIILEEPISQGLYEELTSARQIGLRTLDLTYEVLGKDTILWVSALMPDAQKTHINFKKDASAINNLQYFLEGQQYAGDILRWQRQKIPYGQSYWFLDSFSDNKDKLTLAFPADMASQACPSWVGSEICQANFYQKSVIQKLQNKQKQQKRPKRINFTIKPA